MSGKALIGLVVAIGLSLAPAPNTAADAALIREPSVWDRSEGYIVAATVMMVAQTVLIAGLLVQRTRRRQAEEHLRVSQAELRGSYDRIRDLGGRLLHAQETERARIARELHDDIGQQVALLAIDLEMLSATLPGDADGLAFDALTRAQGIARGVHDLSHRLHPTKLQLIGLVPALYSLQRELTQSSIALRFTHDNVPTGLAPDLMLGIFRIVQEALQNALKYSRGRLVAMHLCGGPERLTLTIVDDGVGFDVAATWGKGLGLLSIAERAEALGGRFDVQSARGRGTQLEVTVPFRTDDTAAALGAVASPIRAAS
jgi:signal transduction histidine kinase